MAGSEDVRGLAASLGELHEEASPSREEGTNGHGNGNAAAMDDDIWGDASDSPGHGSDLKREWDHRQEQFHKMGYRDGITEGQKDVAQEGFNLGHRQSAHVGYKWGLVRGITSALASLPNSLKEKLLLDAQRRGKLKICRNLCKKFQQRVLCGCFTRVFFRIIVNQRKASFKLFQGTFYCCYTDALMFKLVKS